MGYNFEKFTGFNARTTKPVVSITRAKAIGLSSAFCAKYNVDQFNFAVLYYDRAGNSIGFRLTNDEKEVSKFTVTKTRKGTKGSSITSQSFFNTNKIPVDLFAHQYSPKEKELREVGIDEKGKLFIIDLKEKQP